MPTRKPTGKPTGRPPGRHFDKPFLIRFPAGQLENIRQAALEDGVDVAVWIRDAATWRLRARTRFKKTPAEEECEDPAGV